MTSVPPIDSFSQVQWCYVIVRSRHYFLIVNKFARVHRSQIQYVSVSAVSQKCRYRRHSAERVTHSVSHYLTPQECIGIISLSVAPHTTDLTSVCLKSQCTQQITHPTDQQTEGSKQWDLRLLWWSSGILCSSGLKDVWETWAMAVITRNVGNILRTAINSVYCPWNTAFL